MNPKKHQIVIYEIQNCKKNIKFYESMIEKNIDREFYKKEIENTQNKLQTLTEAKKAYQYY